MGYDSSIDYPVVLIFHAYKENPKNMAGDTGFNRKR